MISLFLIASLFSTGLCAGLLNGSQWIIKPGDSLYKIARSIYPNNTKQQAQLRKALVEQNPSVFKNGSSNISVGDKLQLPAFAIVKKRTAPVSAPVKIAKQTKPKTKQVPKVISSAKPAQITKTDSDDAIGQVIINVGSLSAINHGTTRLLNRRSSIYNGDTISTGKHSLTQIRLKDGALLSLRPHTDLRIADYRYNGQQDGSEQNIMELLKGGFRTITGAIGHLNKQNYQVRTSVATIGIRGTHYSILLCQQSSCSNDDGANAVEDGLYGGVADGSIVIENKSGKHRFNNDQYFKLTSSSAAPIEFLYPPAVLLHGASKLAGTNNKTQKKDISRRINSRHRRMIKSEVIRPVLNEVIKPPQITEFLPTKAPNGSAVLIGFNQINADGLVDGAAAPVLIAPNNDNQILLGPNRTPIAGREASIDIETGLLVRHELAMASPDGTLATLVPSSVGGNPLLGVNWGRWNGEYTVLEDGNRIETKDNFHYIYSENITSPDQLANLGGIIGSASYSMASGTLPTDDLGNVAATLPTINMNVDFINQQVTNYDINATIAGSFYNASASNIAFQDLGSSFNIQSISTGCISSCVGEASVLFVGPEADGALTSYHIEDISGSTGITGTGLLTRPPLQ